MRTVNTPPHTRFQPLSINTKQHWRGSPSLWCAHTLYDSDRSCVELGQPERPSITPSAPPMSPPPIRHHRAHARNGLAHLTHTRPWELTWPAEGFLPTKPWIHCDYLSSDTDGNNPREVGFETFPLHQHASIRHQKISISVWPALVGKEQEMWPFWELRVLGVSVWY